MRGRLLIAALVGSLLSCGDASAATATLTMRASADDGRRESVAQLRCRTNREGALASWSGTRWARRGAARRCRAAFRLARVGAFAAPPSDRICTDIYGGPQTFRVSGRVAGRTIRRTFTRRDGCEIADFDRVLTLVRGSPAEPR